MNSKRSYLDTINAGRQRRSYASLEQLNKSLDTLEQTIERNREEVAGYGGRTGHTADYRSPDYRTPDYRSPEHRLDTARDAEDHRAYEHHPYRAIARDMERVRRDEDGVAAFGRIAGELNGLREEMRQQMASSMRREFDALRMDLQQVSIADSQAAGQLGLDVERLYSAVQSLGERGDERSISILRSEMEQLRGALDNVAREETLRSVDRRFDDFENRLSGAANGIDREALAALAQRVEQIGDAVGNLPESLSLRTMEDKVRTLATALDHFIEHQDGHARETFAQIEVRLDEISRAIVGATVAAQQNHVDPQSFERIEARIGALARQIEEVAEDRHASEMASEMGGAIVDHIQALSRRVDDLAARSAMPDEAIERLAYQLSVIADKVDHAPALPDVGDIFSGIDQRFDVLSNLFERRQEDALEQGNVLFRELERRLNDVAERIDRRQADAGQDGSLIMQAIDRRFTELTAALETGRRDPAADEAIRGIETRLEGISRRLDDSASKFAAIDPELVRNLEAQVAGLSDHLSKPNAPLPEFVDISPRLKEIERSIAESRESVIEAARTAAEHAARSFAESRPQADVVQAGAVSELADEMKSLETLTRRSDERNAKTFEAIHDTLLKIVDRMGSLERDGLAPRKLEVLDVPSIDGQDAFPEDMLALADDLAAPKDEANPVAGPVSGRVIVERSPAQAATAAAIAAVGGDEMLEPAENKARGVRAMLSGLTKAFARKDAKEPALAGSELPGSELPGSVLPESSLAEPVLDAAPTVDLDMPLDPKLANRPLEPGSGAPDLNAIMKRVRDERGQPARHGDTDAGKADFIAAARRAAQAAAAEADVKRRKSDVGNPVKALRFGELLKSRRKTVLMGATALMTALAGMQLAKAYMNDAEQTASAVQPPVVSLAAKPEAPGKTAGVASDPLSARMAQTAARAAAELPTAEDIDAMIEETVSSALAEPMDDLEITEEAHAVADTVTPEKIAEKFEVSALEIPADAGPEPLREAASTGDAKALFEVATRYAEGRGAGSDMAKAANWYGKSAERGFAPAQYRLGNMYEKGIGVERDFAKAREWYLKAATSGNASAMHNLAVLYATGAEGKADNDEAAKWFIRAAELGVKDSQFNLGILAAKGAGMKQSLEESYKWFALVAGTGDKDAAAKRDEIANALRPEQLQRARASAELWKPRPLDAAANSVDIPAAWQESGEMTASRAAPVTLKTVQQILNRIGYDAGAADGKMGGKTKAAIEKFQKDNALAVTGQIDETLVRTLMARG